MRGREVFGVLGATGAQRRSPVAAAAVGGIILLEGALSPAHAQLVVRLGLLALGAMTVLELARSSRPRIVEANELSP